MPLSFNSTEERLKQLKDSYVKLFADRGSERQSVFKNDEYLSTFRRLLPSQRPDTKNFQEERRDRSPNRLHDDKIWAVPKTPPPRLKIRPLLEDLNKKTAIEKRNFMLQRMDDLSATKPARIMDYVRKQYPIAEDTSANTFFILGDVHRCIREYLIGNGWIEKYSNSQEERTHLIRSLQGLPTGDNRSLGRMLAADPVKFIWVNGFINWSLISNSVIVSRIPSSSYYFSKTSLASSIRDLFPFLYQKGMVDVQTPRTYEVRAPDDMKHFVKQYRINACVSLMRRFLSSLEPSSKIPLFSEEGTVPLDSIDFAVQRIVEVIRYHQHADLDEWHFSVVSDEDWNVFMFRFYDIIHQDAKFQIKHHNISIPKLAYACEKLCIIFEKFFPDTKHDGHRNLWIVKPSNGSCGRGVKVFKRITEIQQYCKPTSCYVIQKYIENPLLLYQTKFDIRQWFLITSVYPLIIWMYEECYLRFCSQQFSLTNVHESVHLCNNSVQYKYKNGSRSPQLPDDNMWDDRTFQMYLSDRESTTVWSEIKNKMQQAIVAACLVSQDKMYHRTNSFHLYGADFMITPDYDVWLIEINTHPSMKYSTSVTTRMCKEVLQDTLKVGLERRSNPHADTGKFTEIYRQQTHMPTVGVPASAAGVHARKIRLLSQSMAKETPSKTYEETSRAPTKYGKWITYSNVATYKKHSKVNFKYVVLRHTDMPLDPGDSITQRDIGYAGVLDKIYVNENQGEENEEVNISEVDIGEKEKKESPSKLTSKPVNQVTMHRKVIAKLKAKEKTSSDMKENAEGDTEKCIDNLKYQYAYESQIEAISQSNDMKQNEEPKSNTDAVLQQSKSNQSEIVHEVRSITETKRLQTEDSEKDENPDKSIKPKKKGNSEIIKNSKKSINKESPTTQKSINKESPTTQKSINKESPTNREKSIETKKNINLENEVSTEKRENLKKPEISEQTTNSKNIANPDKPTSLKKAANQAKAENAKKILNLEHISENNANTDKLAQLKKVVSGKAPTVQRKVPVGYQKNKNITKKENNSKTAVLPDAKEKMAPNMKNSKEFTSERRSHNKSRNSPKISNAKRNAGIKLVKKPSSAVEKILSDKLRVDSINFLTISQKEREKNLTKKHSNYKLRGPYENNIISVKHISNNIDLQTKKSKKRGASMSSHPDQNSDASSSLKVIASGKRSTGIVRPKLNNPGNRTIIPFSSQRTSTSNPLYDSTNTANINHKSEATIDDFLSVSPSEYKKLLNTEKERFVDKLLNEDFDEDELEENDFIPSHVLFLISDSENSFKTAGNGSDEDSLDEESINSLDPSLNLENMEDTSINLQSSSFGRNEKIYTSKIKRYNNRNKYCE